MLACGEDPSEAGPIVPAESTNNEAPVLGHIGRVHLVLQPQPDVIEPEPQLQLHARFIEYRGVSEDFVRARANLPVPVWEQLVLGQCVASETLLPPSTAPIGSDEDRELSMLDAGDLRISFGEHEIVAPLALVPDILPWLSGVEYEQVDDRIPRLPFTPDGSAPLTVSVGGEAELEGFSVSVAVPVPLALARARVEDQSLAIEWRPPGSTSDTLVLRLQAFAPSEDGVSEPTGEELTCLVADTGRTDLALSPLAHEGLNIGAERLRVSASRFDHTKVNAGSFGDVEILVELRAQRTLPLTAALDPNL